jgi:futalosine hydrolase
LIPAQTIPDRVLIVLAAPAEARAARTALGLGDAPRGSFWRLEAGSSGIDLVESGVGKAQAAGATAAVFDPVRHAGVLSVGIGGAYAGSGLAIGERVLADASGFADEGIETPDGFETIASAGFPPARFGQAAEIDPRWRAVLGTIVDRIGGVATVSVCSGTDARADAIRARTGSRTSRSAGAIWSTRCGPISADAHAALPLGASARAGALIAAILEIFSSGNAEPAGGGG